MQVKIGVFPRCSACRKAKKSFAYCGTESAVRACLNWPPEAQLPSSAVESQTKKDVQPIVIQAAHQNQGTRKASGGLGKSPAANRGNNLPKERTDEREKELVNANGSHPKKRAECPSKFQRAVRQEADKSRLAADNDSMTSEDEDSQSSEESRWTDEQLDALRVRPLLRPAPVNWRLQPYCSRPLTRQSM